MIGLEKIHSFRNYVSRFRWENYQREYRKLTDIKYLYWHIVILDYLDSTYDHQDHRTYSTFSSRVFKSYMGVFYKPHEIRLKFESNLDGFSKLYINNNYEEWTTWTKNLKDEFSKQFSVAREIMHINLEHKNESETPDNTIDLAEFDTLHKNIEQVISSILNEHLVHTRYQRFPYSTVLENFPISISKELIDEIHTYADDYFRSRFTFMFLNKFEAKLPTDRPFTLVKFDSIQDAFDSLLSRFPEFKSLRIGTLVEMMDLYSQDLDGKKFNKASVRAYLTRNGYN